MGCAPSKQMPASSKSTPRAQELLPMDREGDPRHPKAAPRDDTDKSQTEEQEKRMKDKGKEKAKPAISKTSTTTTAKPTETKESIDSAPKPAESKTSTTNTAAKTSESTKPAESKTAKTSESKDTNQTTPKPAESKTAKTTESTKPAESKTAKTSESKDTNQTTPKPAESKTEKTTESKDTNKTTPKPADTKETKSNSKETKQEPSKAKTTKISDLSEAEMKKEAEAILKTQQKLYEQTKGYWKDSDLTSQELQDHMKAVRASYTAFGEFPYRIKFDFRGKLTLPIINSGTLKIVCDVAVKLLEENAYLKTEQGKREVLEGQARMLENCLQVVSSFTDTTLKARLFVIEYKKLLPLLVQKLDEWFPLYMDRKLKDMEEKILNRCLTILFMVAAQEDRKHMDHLRSIPQLVPVVKKYLASNSAVKNADNRLTAIATLAYTATDAEAQDITTDKSVVGFVLDQLRQAYKKKSLDSPSGWTITGLAKAVKNLARNDANKRLLVKEGALQVMFDGLKEKHQKSHNWKERKCCMESLWWLSFDPQNREEIAKMEDLLDMVVELYKEGPNPQTLYFDAAEGFLFQMQDHIKKNNKYADVAVKLLGDKAKHVASPASDTGHVMMSYQTQYRPIVKSICDFLREKGFRMWMDVYNMAEGEESTLQTMAEAVEGSAVVLMCVSESYKDSPYCRAEAEYAFMKKKYIIPLKLQKGYVPDGWLGIIQGSKFFYDFTKETGVEQKRLQLLDAVRKATEQTVGPAAAAAADQQRSGTSSSAPKGGTSMESTIKAWVKEDVKKWLQSYNLSGEKLEALGADEILYLYSLKSEAPEQFHSVLRDELELSGLSRPASFNKAMDELPSYTLGTH